jgi:hypothetical protein
VVRTAAVLTVLAVLAWYYAVSEDLPALGIWGDVVFLSFGLIPLTFLLPLIALPLRRSRMERLGWAAIVLVAVSVLLELANLDIAANFVKVATVVCVAWWFLSFFEALSWVLLIAVLIVPVDIFSVARGPTKEIVENQPQVFNALSISFPLPGEHNSAQLGLPTSSSSRSSSERPTASACASADLDPHDALVRSDARARGRLRHLRPPALPLLSVGFVLANADHLWRYYKDWRSARDSK